MDEIPLVEKREFLCNLHPRHRQDQVARDDDEIAQGHCGPSHEEVGGDLAIRLADFTDTQTAVRQ